MRINTWNTETDRGGKAHTGTLSDPEPTWKSMQGGLQEDSGVCVILDAPDGKSFRITFTREEARKIGEAVAA